MRIKHSDTQTSIALDPDETTDAIIAYLQARGVYVDGKFEFNVNGGNCEDVQIFVKQGGHVRVERVK